MLTTAPAPAPVMKRMRGSNDRARPTSERSTSTMLPRVPTMPAVPEDGSMSVSEGGGALELSSTTMLCEVTVSEPPWTGAASVPNAPPVANAMLLLTRPIETAPWAAMVVLGGGGAFAGALYLFERAVRCVLLHPCPSQHGTCEPRSKKLRFCAHVDDEYAVRHCANWA